MAESLSSVSGLASGIDFTALVDSIIALEKRPANRLQALIDKDVKRRLGIESFRGALNGLKNATKALQDGSALDDFNTTVTGTDTAGRTLLAATAGAGARPGSYQMEVRALASAQKVVGTAQPSLSAGLGLTGDLEIAGRSVTLTAADSLIVVRDRINLLNVGPTATKVTASILSVSPTDHRLILTADQAGTTGGFTVANRNGGTLVQTFGLDAAPVAEAKDAEFKVDGVTIFRPTNVVSDVIPGVTLTLSNAEVGRTASVQVTRNAAASQAGAQAFVDAYNTVVTFIKDQEKAGTDGMPALSGDVSLRATRSALSAALLSKGGVGTAADLSTFAAAGISVTREGTLTLDAAKFQAASSARSGDLAAMLSDRGAAISGALDGLLRTGSGTLDVRRDAIDVRVGTFTDRINDLNSRLEKRRSALLAQYARTEAVIGRLNSIQSSIGAQFQALTKSNDS
jgi:flagellar hook-associated protein 2